MALAGIVAGGVGHTVLALLGVGAVIHAAPGLLNAMLLAGAAYLGWIGGSLMRSASPVAAVARGVGVRLVGLARMSRPRPPQGTTAVTSISTLARASIRAATCTQVMAGKCLPITSR